MKEVAYSSYQDFEREKMACRRCSVGQVYDCVVCSDGCKTNPIVMVVGESPGRDEIIEKKPFVGKAGQKLRSTLNACGFRTINTIISNVIPCRPLDNKFPADSKLVLDCVEMWLYKEIEILKPKFLFLLGNQPLKYILGLEGITSKRGSWYDFHGIRAMPTYHPSYVIRKAYMAEGEKIEGEFLSDIQCVAKEAGFFTDPV